MAALLPHSEEPPHMCRGWLKQQQGSSEDGASRNEHSAAGGSSPKRDDGGIASGSGGSEVGVDEALRCKSCLGMELVDGERAVAAVKELMARLPCPGTGKIVKGGGS